MWYTLFRLLEHHKNEELAWIDVSTKKQDMVDGFHCKALEGRQRWVGSSLVARFSRLPCVVFVFKFFCQRPPMGQGGQNDQKSSHLSRLVTGGLRLNLMRWDDQIVPSINHYWYYTTLVGQRRREWLLFRD